jgi:hypothetical protein
MQVGVKNSLHLPAYEDVTVFRNVAGELPRRKHTTFRTHRKFEIKNILMLWHVI